MGFLTKNRALIIAQQIELLVNSDLIEINVDRMKWEFIVPHPHLTMNSVIDVTWNNIRGHDWYGTILVDNPDPMHLGEVHKSLADFKEFYNLKKRGPNRVS